MELYIYCLECNHGKNLTPEILAMLEIDDGRELSPSDINTEKLSCSKCGSKKTKCVPLQIIDDSRNAVVDEGKNCIQCGKRIPSERLSAIPNAIRCVECQNNPRDTCEDSVDYGDDDIGSCPRCGSPLVWKERVRDNPLWNIQGSRYFLGCSNYPRCHYIERNR